MYIYNISFIVEPADGPRFLTWLVDEAIPALVNEHAMARNPKLSQLAEVPGQPGFANQAYTFALQLEFMTLDEAHLWAEAFLPKVLESYANLLGAKKAISFSTILRKITI